MGYREWIAKQKGNKSLLVVAAIGFSVSFYTGFRYLYKPWEKRRRLAQNEKYAEIVYRQRMAK